MADITWRNINTSGGGATAARFAALGGQQINQGFADAQKLLAERETALTKSATDDALGAIMMAGNQGELQQALGQGQKGNFRVDQGALASAFGARETALLKNAGMGLDNTGKRNVNDTFMKKFAGDMAAQGATTDYTKSKTVGSGIGNVIMQREADAQPKQIEDATAKRAQDLVFGAGRNFAQAEENKVLPERIKTEQDILKSQATIAGSDAEYRPAQNQMGLNVSQQGINKSIHDMRMSRANLALDKRKAQDARNASAKSGQNMNTAEAGVLNQLIEARSKGDKEAVKRYYAEAQVMKIPNAVINSAMSNFEAPKGGDYKIDSTYVADVMANANTDTKNGIQKALDEVQTNKGMVPFKDANGNTLKEKLSPEESEVYLTALADNATRNWTGDWLLNDGLDSNDEGQLDAAKQEALKAIPRMALIFKKSQEDADKAEADAFTVAQEALEARYRQGNADQAASAGAVLMPRGAGAVGPTPFELAQQRADELARKTLLKRSR